MKTQYTIDAVGTLYPMIMTKDFQSLFRIECNLTEDVDGEVLQKAVDIAFLRFPYYRICLKRGRFRFVFEENDRPFVVHKNDGDVLKIIDWEANNGHLLEVTYLDKKIILEMFHAVSDANGGIEFLKAVVYHYITLKYGAFDSQGKVMLGEYDGDPRETIDDQFTHRNKGGNKSKVSIGKMIGATAFCPKGAYHNRPGYDVTSVVATTASLKTAAKKYDCSITQYLMSVATFAVAELYAKEAQKKNIVIFVPINMRSRFPSVTMRNFVSFAKCAYKIPKQREDFLTIVESMKKELKDNTTQEELQKRLNFSTLLERLWLTKYMPLRLIHALVYLSNKNAKQSQTFILSNLGPVQMADSPYIKDMCILVNTNNKTPRNIGMASYGDRTIINFTSRLVSKDVEEFFIDKLISDGVAMLND